MFTASPTSTNWWIWDLQRLHWLSLAWPTNWTCSSSHLHAKVQKSLFCQRRTFQSTSMTAAEANTGAGFPECCLHLSASSSSGAKPSWPLLYINFCLSPEDIWRAHLLQKMCTAECQQHIKAKDSPEVSNTCWKAEQKGQYSWGCICQGHKRQEIRCFSWSSGVFHFSLPLSFQSFDTAGVIGGQTTFISLFFFPHLFISLWSSFPPAACWQEQYSSWHSEMMVVFLSQLVSSSSENFEEYIYKGHHEPQTQTTHVVLSTTNVSGKVWKAKA